jgi:hypothetical protein
MTFVVMFGPGIRYLRLFDSYDQGTLLTSHLRKAKLFPSYSVALQVSDLLGGIVQKVIPQEDGMLVWASDNHAPVPKQDGAGATKKELANHNGDATAPSPLPHTPIASDAKKLFFEFLSRYLGVEIYAIQPGYGIVGDSYLFKGPHGTSMCVPTSVMLLHQPAALAVIQEKISAKRKEFEGVA